ncbi:dTDP-3-amino-3,6-dideoxy-alpha-D-galactopyranose transaminase [Caloramator mitchellensis]|uniref:dTDP-3-amino-3,6-dideoxy-alpha-D-galactopyranose transaminase n=1 Tax=Caloramator mitchellensis TaxID=908809 RepID=A0A0R3JV43_CALMK|nr:DegT/DnrJ/EryC1/StrS family aminotransferase [Caloramator mitchellensis]KRQ87427.1 dTDP-3-amino-3,6-dideoxy-alpha-D-galactopyranose transaminase [Caloramator mitchellensis]
MIQLLDLLAQYETMKDEMKEAVISTIESGHYILGPQVKKLEEDIARYCNVKHGIGVANGTDALVLTLKAFGIGEGDEVITSPFTFFASAETISQVGATPVFVDIEPDTYNIDAEKIEEKITEKTKAIIPVHIFGQMCDMDRIMEIARKHNLIVIEDACQAIGSEYKGKKAGSIGHAACFSFFPTKNLGGYGDGGMIVTNDDELAAKIRMLRFHGSKVKYYHDMLGFNSRLDELQAAILNVKFKYLDEWNNKRNEKAHIYNELLKDTSCKVPTEREYNKHIYHLYIIQHEKREELINFLKENGVATGIYYPVPLHLQNVYKYLGYKEGDLPNSEYASKRTFAIPLYPELTLEQQKYVANKIKEFES